MEERSHLSVEKKQTDNVKPRTSNLPKHDVIFFSGRTWEHFAAPHRIALALAQLGCKILFCESPVSPLRKAPRPMRVLENGVCLFQPAFLSARIGRLALARDLQAKAIIRQIEQASAECGLRDPIFLHGYAGDCGSVCRQMKKKYFVVHVCTDYAPCEDRREQDFLVEVSDKTLVIPPTRFHQLKARFGHRISLIPQAVDFHRLVDGTRDEVPEPSALAGIPKPRLGYLGPPNGRLNAPVLSSLLRSHPEWHFVSVGSTRTPPLPNTHALPWEPGGAAQYAQNFDVGFMPYNCDDEQALNCVPLKMFEYFAFGIPVVSTPVIHLWEYKNLIYFGDTAEELASAVKDALSEPANSPKRAARIEIARSHSLESLATVLQECLPLDEKLALLAPRAGAARMLKDKSWA